MSNTIDRRIVDMEFNNEQFEKGIKQSVKSLEAFQKSLKMDNATKGLDEIERSVRRFDFDPMARGIENLERRFSAMGIFGMRVIERLSDKVISAGERMAKSLSVDQLNAGFSKYEDKTKSVQTIVNATGKSIEQVDTALNKLAWFTDETSYNFVDMVSNIGKFTSMNIDLEDAVTAMEGIATEAALSGQGISEASRAMYNFAQAIGAGSVKLMDWRSIENANMATAEFKTTIIDTAKELGLLNKEGKTKRGTLVDFKNFSQTLSEGWFTSDVLIKSLKKYGEYADEVYKIASREGITAAEAMAKYSNEAMKLGEKAFKAAQEAKTFNDAIEATKDAVSTGWMNTFELIFGNYEEAKVLWTDLANALWEVFAAGAEERNEVLKAWHDTPLAGREMALKAVYSILNSIWNIAKTMKGAISEIFPPMTLDNLQKMTIALTGVATQLKSIAKITSRFTGYEIEELDGGFEDLEEKLNQTLKKGSKGEGVKALQKRLVELGYDVGKAGVDGILGPDTEAALKKFEEDAGQTIDGIYDQSTHKSLIDMLVDKRGGNKKLVEKYEEILSPFLERVKSITGGIAALAHILWRAFSFVFQIAANVLSKLAPLGDALFTIAAGLGEWVKGVDEAIGSSGFFEGLLEKINGLLEPFGELVQKAANGLLHFFGFDKEASESTKDLTTFLGIWNHLKTSLEKSGVIDRLKTAFDKVKNSAKDAWEKIKESFGQGASFLGENFGSWWNGFIEERLPSIIEAVANAFAAFLEWLDPIIQKIPVAWDALKKFLGDIGGKIWNFAKNIPSYIGNLWTFFTDLYNSLKNSERAQQIWEKVKKFFSDLKDNLGSFFIDLWGRIVDFFSPKESEDAVSASEETERKLTIIERVSNIISQAWENIKNIFGPLFESISSFWNKWKFLIIIAGVIVGLLFVVNKFMNSASGILDSIEKIKNGREQVTRKSQTILEIAGAVALIAASIWAIGSMDPAQFKQGALAVIGIGVFLVALMVVGQKLDKSGSSIYKIGQGMRELSVAIAILAAVMFLISFVPWNRYFDGLGKIVLILAALIGVIVLLNKLDSNKIAITGLKDLATAIAILAVVAWGARFIEWRDIGKVAILALIGGGLLIFAGFATKIGKSAKGLKDGSKALLVISVSLFILSEIAKSIGKMSEAEFKQGMFGLAILAAILSAMLFVMSKTSSSVDTGGLLAMLIGFMASIFVFAEILKSIKNVDPKVMIAFAGSLALSLLAVAAVTKIANSMGAANTIKGAAAVAVAFDSVVAIVGSFIAGIGELNRLSNGRIEEDIEEGGKLLNSIGQALSNSDVGLLAAITGAGAILGIAQKHFGWSYGAMFTGEAAIGGLFGAAVAVIGAVLTGLGVLGTLPTIDGQNVSDSITNGGQMLQTIGDALSSSEAGMLAIIAGVGAVVGMALSRAPQLALWAAVGELALGLLFAATTGIAAYVLKWLGDLSTSIDVSDGQTFENKVENGGKFLEAIGRGLASFGSGFSNVVSTDISAFATSINEVNSAIDGMSLPKESGQMSIDDLRAAIGLVTEIKTFFVGLEPYSFIEQAVGYAHMIGYVTAARQLSTDIEAFGKAINTLAQGLNKLDTVEDVTAGVAKAIGGAEQLHLFFTGLEPYAVDPSMMKGYYTAPDQLSTDMTNFAQAIYNFAAAIDSFEEKPVEEQTGVAIRSAGQVKKFFDDLSKETPTGENLTSYTDSLNGIFGEIDRFSITMAGFNSRLGGINPVMTYLRTESVLMAVRKVAQFLHDVGTEDSLIAEKDKNFWQRFISGDTNYNTVMNKVSELGVIVQEKGSLLTTAATTDFATGLDSALGAVDRMLIFMMKLKKMDEEGNSVQEVGTGLSTSFDNLLTGLWNFGQSINNFNNATITMDADRFKTITDGIWNMARSIIGIASIYVPGSLETITNFIDGFDALFDEDVWKNIDTSGVSSVYDTIFNELEAQKVSYYDQFKSVGLYLAEGLAHGIKDGKSGVINAVVEICTAATTTAQAAFDEHSPSKVFASIGRYLDEGLAQGISSNSNVPENAMTLLAQSLTEDMDADPVIRPIVDMSNVESSASRIGGLMNQRGSVTMDASFGRAQAGAIRGMSRNQNGSSVSNTYNSSDDSINFPSATFVIRSDQDIRDLASELASLTNRQNRSMGAAHA